MTTWMNLEDIRLNETIRSQMANIIWLHLCKTVKLLRQKNKMVWAQGGVRRKWELLCNDLSLSGKMKQVMEMNGSGWPHTKKNALNVTELYT